MIDNDMVSNGPIHSSMFVTRRVLACLLFVCGFLLSSQEGRPADDTISDAATAVEGLQPAVSPSVTRTESRDDKRGDVTVSVQNLDVVMRVMTSSVPARLEANVQPVTTAEAEKYGFRVSQGVVIIWLDPKGPLGRAGLATSDIILQIDNQPIEGLENFISLVNCIETLQPATFSVFDHRTGRIRNVRIIVGPDHSAQEANQGFFGRHVDAAFAGIRGTVRSLGQGIGYAAERGKEAIAAAIDGLKRWSGMVERGPVASVHKGEEAPVHPPKPVQRDAGGPG